MRGPPEGSWFATSEARVARYSASRLSAGGSVIEVR